MTLRVAACIDCGTAIIGECLRCPACHDRHADVYVPEIDEDDVMASRQSRERSILQILFSWLVVAEVIAAVIAGIVIAVKGC